MDFPLFQGFIKLTVFRVLGRKQALVETFARGVLAYQDGRNSYEHLSPELRAQLAANSDTLLGETAALTREALKEALKPELLSTQVRVPVTILIGMESPAPFKKAAENVARILRNAPIVWLPESNHLAQIDQPDCFVEAVHRALAQR
jgi:pimeloyl-ACP methyl ester carboxylesterase